MTSSFIIKNVDGTLDVQSLRKTDMLDLNMNFKLIFLQVCGSKSLQRTFCFNEHQFLAINNIEQLSCFEEKNISKYYIYRFVHL